MTAAPRLLWQPQFYRPDGAALLRVSTPGDSGGCKKTMIWVDGGENFVCASHAPLLHPGAEMRLVTGIRDSCNGNNSLADEGRLEHGASGVGAGPLQARTEAGAIARCRDWCLV